MVVAVMVEEQYDVGGQNLHKLILLYWQCKQIHTECIQIERYREQGTGGCSLEIWKVPRSELTHTILLWY